MRYRLHDIDEFLRYYEGGKVMTMLVNNRKNVPKFLLVLQMRCIKFFTNRTRESQQSDAVIIYDVILSKIFCFAIIAFYTNL